MKNITISALLILLLISCAKEESGFKERPAPPSKGMQAVAENKSIVYAKVLNVANGENPDYILDVIAENVEDVSGYQNIAVVGEKYTLKPNYSVDPLGKRFDNEKNKKLLALSSIKTGGKVKLEIVYSEEKGWLINKVLQ